MNKIEYEIMDIISNYPISINELLYGKKISSYRTFELYYQNNDELVKNNILELLSKDIIFIDGINFCNKLDFLSQNFDYHNWTKLTKKGSEYWEKHYQPNWHYYIDVVYDDKDYKNPVNLELISLNEQLLKEICQNLNTNKIKLEILDEWEICYWKTINNQPIFKYGYIAKTLKEKILVDEIWSNLSQNYRDRFCPKSRHFY